MRARDVFGPSLARGDLSELSDELMMLGEEEAVACFFDQVNLRRLRFTVVVLAVVAFTYATVSFSTGRPLLGLLAGAMLVATLVLFRSRSSPHLHRNVRQVGAAVLLVFYASLLAFSSLESDAPALWLTAMVVLAARFRYTPGESIALLTALYAIFAVRLVVVTMLMLKRAFPVGELVAFAMVTLMTLGAAVWVNHRQRRRFTMRWRGESKRHRDRLRMKQELEYAREIQLSMLPRRAPELSWLDIAALSLPANEVGGDYYDYFELDRQRLCVVVGDVTGHGVASGLILSGVRAGLNLLQDEMKAPEAILDRVNRMLVKTATPRMLMTLGVTVLSADDHSAIVATAAHPPALHLRASDCSLVEVGRGSLPLGAREDTGYVSDTVDLEVGDLLLLYSDGLVETVNRSAEQYGWERLERLLEEIGLEGSAAEVRDAVLRDVWDFKGQAEQVDDVTMVAIRVIG